MDDPDIFADPARAIAHLRNAHKQSDAGRYQFMKMLLDALTTDDPHTEMWQQYSTAGLYQAAVEIASDHTIYTLPSPENIRYLLSVYHILAPCGQSILDRLDRATSTPTSVGSTVFRLGTEFVQQTRTLWDALWSLFRTSSLSGVKTAWWQHRSGVSKAFWERFVSLLGFAHEVHVLCKLNPSDSGRLPQITCYTWVYTLRMPWNSGVARLLHSLWISTRNVHASESDRRRSLLAFKAIIEEFLTLRIITRQILEKHIAASFRHRHTVDGSLSDYYGFCMSISRVYPDALLLPRGEGSTVNGPTDVMRSETTMLSIAKACRRQMCTGKQLYEVNTCACTLVLWQNILDFTTPKGALFLLPLIFRSEEGIKIVEIVAHSVVVLLQNNEDAMTKTPMGLALRLLEMFSLFREDLLTRYWGTEALERFRSQTLPRLYSSTLQELRAISLSNINHEPMRRRTIDAWKKACQQLSCDVTSDTNEELAYLTTQLADATLEDHWEPSQRCHLTTCMCTDPTVDPGHRMRPCKGCWSVYYCSPKCQTKDWPRHRAVCKPLVAIG